MHHDNDTDTFSLKVYWYWYLILCWYFSWAQNVDLGYTHAPSLFFKVGQKLKVRDKCWWGNLIYKSSCMTCVVKDHTVLLAACHLHVFIHERHEPHLLLQFCLSVVTQVSKEATRQFLRETNTHVSVANHFRAPHFAQTYPIPPINVWHQSSTSKPRQGQHIGRPILTQSVVSIHRRLPGVPWITKETLWPLSGVQSINQQVYNTVYKPLTGSDCSACSCGAITSVWPSC